MRCLEQFLHSNHNLKKAFFAFLLLFANTIYAKITIEILPVVELEKNEVLIKDISKINSSKKEDRLKDFIGSIFIKEIKQGVVKVKKDEILKKLKDNYIDTSNILITGQDYAIVKRKSIKLGYEDIKKDIKKFIDKNPNLALKSISLSKKEYILPFGEIEKKIVLKSKTSTHMYIDYLIFVDKKLYKKIPITLRVERFVLVPYAKRDILKNRKISKEDIYFKKEKRVRVSQILGEDEIVGKVAKREIKKDSIIKRYFIEPNYLVKKRKNVKIIYKNGPIKIELMGLALENGELNQIIKVKNISTNKVIKCKVIAPYVVEFIN